VPDISILVKLEADKIEQNEGKNAFAKKLIKLDKKILERIDNRNPVRTRRAWEVITQTGKSLADWQDDTPAPLINFSECIPVNLISDTHWLNNRIKKRFNIMMEKGALDECKNILKLDLWNADHPSCKAIGAKELISHIQNGDDLNTSVEKAIIQTHQYAKRQRTWFRSKMSNWHKIDVKNIYNYIH
jgi:tRNA dimethylallyltransferase